MVFTHATRNVRGRGSTPQKGTLNFFREDTAFGIDQAERTQGATNTFLVQNFTLIPKIFGKRVSPVANGSYVSPDAN